MDVSPEKNKKVKTQLAQNNRKNSDDLESGLERVQLGDSSISKHVPKKLLHTNVAPVHLFILSKWHPPSPNTLCNPALVDVVHQMWDGPRAPPEPAAVAGWRNASQLPGALAGKLLQPRRFHPGNVHFSQDHCHPPPPPTYPTSHSLAMIWENQKGFPIQQKHRQNLRPA